MKKIYVLFLTLLISATSFGQLINEFEPNPNGTDPAMVSVELKGTPSTSFNGYILGIENDGYNGLVDRFTSVSGNFDVNGLLVVMIPDLENPSFTIVLVDTFSGDNATDIDPANDGTLDLSTFGTVYDAIGIPDSEADAMTMYGITLGGSDFVYTGDEPRLVFRDGVTDDLYAVNDVTGDDLDEIFDINALLLSSGNFDVNPAAANTFGATNPIYTAPTGPSLTITDPTEAAIFPPGTTSVNLSIIVQNFAVDALPGDGGTGDGHIHWTINASSQPMKYNINDESISVSDGNSYTIYMELVDNTHTPINPAINATVNFSVGSATQVADLAALRADVLANGEGGFYELMSVPTVTYARTSRNQKYVQDSSGAGILIDDSVGTITTTFVIGDGISGLVGQTSSFGSVLQFVPSVDASVVAGATVVPEVVDIATLVTNWEDYESELIKINSVTFADAGGTFASSTVYNISDPDVMAFRTNFSEADYIGQTIPSGANAMVVLVAEFNGTPQVVARSLADLSLSVDQFEIGSFSVYPNPVSDGIVTITSRSNEAISIAVFDILGKQVINETLSNNTLNVSNLNTGIYIMKISQNGNSITKKLVIK